MSVVVRNMAVFFFFFFKLLLRKLFNARHRNWMFSFYVRKRVSFEISTITTLMWLCTYYFRVLFVLVFFFFFVISTSGATRRANGEKSSTDVFERFLFLHLGRYLFERETITLRVPVPCNGRRLFTRTRLILWTRIKSLSSYVFFFFFYDEKTVVFFWCSAPAHVETKTFFTAFAGAIKLSRKQPEAPRVFYIFSEHFVPRLIVLISTAVYPPRRVEQWPIYGGGEGYGKWTSLPPPPMKLLDSKRIE